MLVRAVWSFVDYDAADTVAWLHRKGWWVKLELVCSWRCLLRRRLLLSIKRLGQETRRILKRLSEISSEKSSLNEKAAVIGLLAVLRPWL